MATASSIIQSSVRPVSGSLSYQFICLLCSGLGPALTGSLPSSITGRPPELLFWTLSCRSIATIALVSAAAVDVVA